MATEADIFELEIGTFTYKVAKVNYKPDTWNVMCSLIDYSFFIPAQEKWSPLITVTCQTAEEVEPLLTEMLTYIETKRDPFLKTRRS